MDLVFDDLYIDEDDDKDMAAFRWILVLEKKE